MKKILIILAVIAATPAAAMTKHDKEWFDNLAKNFAYAKASADFCPGVELNKDVFLRKMAQIQNKKEENYFFDRVSFHAEDLMAYIRENDVKQWCSDQFDVIKKTFQTNDAPVFYSNPPEGKAPQG